jgi:uncharacterized membrane protein HdeD (DUF308 family)
MMKFDNRLSEVEQATKWWWVFLITGALWLILSLVVFRFDATTVAAIGILIAVFVIMAGVNEFFAIGVTEGGWKWVHGVLGGLFIVFGVVALVYPGRTFVTMASIMGFVLILKGGFDIVVAFMTKGEHDLWWLQLIAGIVEIGLAFWAAGWFGREVILLVAFVGAWCLVRGITEIILAFQLRSVHKKAELGTLELPGAVTPPPATGQSGATAPA